MTRTRAESLRRAKTILPDHYTYHPRTLPPRSANTMDLGHYHRDEVEETLGRLKSIQRQIAVSSQSAGPCALDHPC
jgi:hypothetical protein